MFSLRSIFFYILFSFFIFYFAYHLFSGEKTIFNFIDNGPRILQLESRAVDLGDREKFLQNRVESLRDGSIDLDLLDEEVRRDLYYLDDDEVVLPLGE